MKENLENEKSKVEIKKVTLPTDPKEFEEIFGFNPTEVTLLIATPCYGGLLYEGYFRSILNAASVLSQVGIKTSIKTISNESLITRARNTLVSFFLTKEEYTHMLFIDADVSFEPMAIISLLKANKPVISGIYPKKGYNWKKITRLIEIQPNWKNGVQSRLLDYVVNFLSNKIEIEKNLVKVKDAPTGFMMIQKNTFSVLKETYPELSYKNDLEGLDENDFSPENFWLFFDCIKDEDGRYLSEDYAFCRLVQRAGLDCWADLGVNLNHTGTHTFEGNILKSVEINLD